ncbi:MAG: 4Fe-4S dicluster domain-containing protein [Candidatus Hodarchaeales archaeon]|jgi:molybdopterin-containing oxidoreductase family iron-sulfur binding subunit
MDKSKRKFLKTAIAGLGVTVVGGVALSQNQKVNLLGVLNQPKNTSDETPKISTSVPDDPKHQWGFMIDLSRCNGCVDQDPPPSDENDPGYDPSGEYPKCSYACRYAHYYLRANPYQYWIRVYQQQESPQATPYFFPKPCMNCENPPCLRVCPTGATYKRQDGTVLINHDICIGCRMCMAACPYETRFFWYWDPEIERDVTDYEYSPEHPLPHRRGTVVKCDFCLHMAYRGQLPSCVTACPRGAIYFGDLNQDAVSNGHEVISLRNTLEEHGGYRYKEDEHTHPSVYYLPRATHFEPDNKIDSSSLNIEIESNKDTDEIDVNVRALTEDGSIIKSTNVIIFRETSFGRVFVAEGKTDSDGCFKCNFSSSNISGQTLIAELNDSEKNTRKMVRKHVK